MKKTKRNLFIILSLIILSTFSFNKVYAAEQKIAVVDLAGIFEKFHKTAEAKGKIEKMEKSTQKEYNEMRADLQKVADELDKLNKAATDKTLSKSVRNEKRKAFEMKVVEAQKMRAKVDEFASIRSKQFQEKLMRMKKSVLGDIYTIVSKVGKKQGYNLVLDKTAISGAGSNVILLINGVDDITEAVLKDLNKNSSKKK